MREPGLPCWQGYESWHKETKPMGLNMSLSCGSAETPGSSLCWTTNLGMPMEIFSGHNLKGLWHKFESPRVPPHSLFSHGREPPLALHQSQVVNCPTSVFTGVHVAPLLFLWIPMWLPGLSLEEIVFTHHSVFSPWEQHTPAASTQPSCCFL